MTDVLAETSTPPRYEVADDANVTDDLVDRVTRTPDSPAFARESDTGWVTITWAQFARNVTALAEKLVAEGIRTGDRVAIMSSTRYEWVLCDFAIWTAGAVSVPIYETSSAEQVAWILTDSGAVAAFVADDRCRQLAEPHVTTVWTIDGSGLDALTPSGAPSGALRRGVTADSPATIVYTSGTTGRPKGCVLSHANLCAEVRAVTTADQVSESVLTENSSILLFLPLAHIFARIVQLAAIRNGTLTAHTSDIKNLPTHLNSFHPTLLLAVPRVFEKFTATARHSAQTAGRLRLYTWAEATAIAYSHALDRDGPSPWLRARWRLFDRLVYAKLRAALGGRVTYAVSGAAPLDTRLCHFLRGAGITVLEGYGLTETSAGITLNLPGATRAGTVGRPLPGCAVRIADDAEILVNGPTVFRGYWHNRDDTHTAFTEDGWLRTGDLGRLDADGYLTVTGRKKDIIVTASGKNVAPEILENRLRAHPLIDHCVVLGDQRPYIAALITIDPDAFAGWRDDHQVPATATVAELRHAPALLAAVQTAVDEANAAVSHAEAIKRFRVIPVQFLISDELTPTQKVRRTHVLAKYAHEIDAIYAVGQRP
jgi:long-chain acyl-CoA synthetase